MRALRAPDELGEQRALARADFACHERNRAGPCPRGFEHAVQAGELFVATDEHGDSASERRTRVERERRRWPERAGRPRWTIVLHGRDEPVSPLRDRLDDRRPVGIVSERLPQVGNHSRERGLLHEKLWPIASSNSSFVTTSPARPARKTSTSMSFGRRWTASSPRGIRSALGCTTQPAIRKSARRTCRLAWMSCMYGGL